MKKLQVLLLAVLLLGVYAWSCIEKQNEKTAKFSHPPFQEAKQVYSPGSEGYQCPNCHHPLTSHTEDAVLYQQDRGLIICSDCLVEPDLLDVDHIDMSLEEMGWSTDSREKVRKAIEEIKALAQMKMAKFSF